MNNNLDRVQRRRARHSALTREAWPRGRGRHRAVANVFTESILVDAEKGLGLPIHDPRAKNGSHVLLFLELVRIQIVGSR